MRRLLWRSLVCCRNAFLGRLDSCRILSGFRLIMSTKKALDVRLSDWHTDYNIQTMQTPGQRIRYARELAGYRNQGEFAKLVGLSQAALSEIETGETKLPSLPVALRMSTLLKKSLSWIVAGKDDVLEYPTEAEQELLNMVRAMDAESITALVTLAKALAAKK